jgi:phosphoheptose isomerase
VGADRDGNFTVVWSGPGDDDDFGVYARRYTAGGVAGPVFLVNAYTTGAQGFPAIAMDTDSESAVVWRSFGQDGSDFGIYGRRYSNTGVELGNPFRANTYTTGGQSQPAVAYRADGSFVVAWQSSNQDGDGQGIFARHVDASGAPQGIGFPVNTTTAGSQDLAAVAAHGQGEFVVVWRGNGPGDALGVFGQAFNASGGVQGQEFRVNTYTTGTQGIQGVASTPSGVFAVVWGSNGQDGSDYGIYAQRFGDLIFEDGFE